MAKRKLSDEKLRELREAYESWNPHDPSSETAAELAARFGISKQTMYTYRDQWLDEQRKERQGNAALLEGEGAEAIRFLVSELMQARARIARLEDELDRARADA